MLVSELLKLLSGREVYVAMTLGEFYEEQFIKVTKSSLIESLKKLPSDAVTKAYYDEFSIWISSF